MAYNEMLEYWEKNNITPPTRIVVCAANKHRESGVVICGARHWDSIMRAAADAMGGLKEEGWIDAEQGFIDQFGTFLSRKEAMEIVKSNGQKFNFKWNGYQDTKLYSEGLY